MPQLCLLVFTLPFLCWIRRRPWEWRKHEFNLFFTRSLVRLISHVLLIDLSIDESALTTGRPEWKLCVHRFLRWALSPFRWLMMVMLSFASELVRGSWRKGGTQINKLALNLWSLRLYFQGWEKVVRVFTGRKQVEDQSICTILIGLLGIKKLVI